MTERKDLAPTTDPMSRRLWLVVGFAVLGSPIAWGLNLNINYFLVQPVCIMGGKIAMHITSAVLLAVALASVATSIWLLARNRVPFRENAEGFDGWKAFVGLYGIATGLLFSLAIIAQWVPTFMFDACTRLSI